jgi:hypothetical protein
VHVMQRPVNLDLGLQLCVVGGCVGRWRAKLEEKFGRPTAIPLGVAMTTYGWEAPAATRACTLHHYAPFALP